MMKIVLILIFLISTIRSKDHPNYKSLDPEYYDMDGVPSVEALFATKACDYDCIFNGLFLTAERLKKFPTSCSRVCAYIGIAKACDATEEELTAAFANMKNLIGALIVGWTNYTSVKFLTGLETIEADTGVSFARNPYMVELGLINLTSITAPSLMISNNSMMTTLDIPKLKTLAPYTPLDPKMAVTINPMFSSFCITTKEMEQFLNKTFPGNLIVMGNYCEPIPGQNICTVPDYGCTEVLGNVVIGRGPEWKLEMLKSVEYIFGGLHIYEANLTSFDFLPSLKYIANLDTKKPGLYVQGNTGLKNTTFPSLKKVHSSSSFTIMFADCSEELLTNPAMCIGLSKLEAEKTKWGPLIDGQTCGRSGSIEKKLFEMACRTNQGNSQEFDWMGGRPREFWADWVDWEYSVNVNDYFDYGSVFLKLCRLK